MARRRGASDANEALELFLDTISNTFGGVLFIALLVCILVQIRGKTDLPTPEASIRAGELQDQVKALQGEIDLLRGIDRRLAQQMKDLLGTQADRELAEQYQTLAGAQKEEEAKADRLGAAIKRFGPKNDRLARRRDDLRIEQLRREKALSKREAQLDLALRKEAHKLRLPRFHESKKAQVPVLLAGQRMCLAYRHDASGNPVHYSDDVSVTADGKEMRPKPGRGTKISDTDAFRAQLKKLLQSVDKGTHYVAVAVWPDSYREFEILRDALVELGFGYYLMLMSEGKPVPVGPGGPKGEL